MDIEKEICELRVDVAKISTQMDKLSDSVESLKFTKLYKILTWLFGLIIGGIALEFIHYLITLDPNDVTHPIIRLLGRF